MSSNILILNLTRMGDLLQNSPLILGLRQKEPDCGITMLANVKFAGITGFMKGIDELITFDMAQFGSADGSETDALAVYNYLDRLTADLNSRKFDTIINLSHTKVSAVLARLIGAPDVRGFLSTPRGALLVRNPWLIYFTSFLSFRKFNRFNLVDMYSKSAGVEPGENVRLNIFPDAESVETFQQALKERGISPGDLVVGIQAGASREDRRWSPKRFAAVADRLIMERGAKVVLLGAASEKRLGDEVGEAMTGPAINLIGKTDLGELTLWVKRLNLLITNDTGTMHIAAALGTPIVALFFVHARAEETGPYCEGAIVLQSDIDCAPCFHQTKCGHLSCLVYINPEDVAAACEMALDGKKTAPEDRSLFRRVRVYRSEFGDDGGVDFRPLQRAPLNKFELFAYLYRPIFNEALPKWHSPETMETGGGIGEKAMDDLMERFWPSSEGKVEQWIERAIEGADRLRELSEKGESLAVEIIGSGVETDAKRMAGIGDELAAADYSISVLAQTHEAIGPLASVYKRRTENFEGDDPVDLARQARQAHRWLRMSAGLFADVSGRALERIATNRKEYESHEISKGNEP